MTNINHKNNAFAKYKVAVALISQKKSDAGATILRQLSDQYPQWSLPILLLYELTLNGDIQMHDSEYKTWINRINHPALECDPIALYVRAWQAEIDHNYKEAERLLEICIDKKTDFNVAVQKLACIKLKNKSWKEAELLLKEQLQKTPKQAHLLLNLSVAFMRQNKLDEALASALDAKKYAMKDQMPSVWVNIGSILQELGERTEAENYYNLALKADPNNVNAILNLGVIRLQKKKFDKAEISFRRVLELEPDDERAAVNLAGILLRTKKPQEGWQYFEKRILQADIYSEQLVRLNKWHGEKLKGSLILMHEQGLGDTFQFIRYAHQLQQQGTDCHFLGPEKLHNILNQSNLVKSCLSEKDGLPSNAQAWIPLMSLPGRLGVSIQETKTLRYPYINSCAKKISTWKQILGKTRKRRFALHWQGNPEHEFTIARGRSIALKELEPLLQIKDIEWISLQKGAGSEQAHQSPWSKNWHPRQKIIDSTWDFNDALAILSCCDGLISSDSGLAHLAGAAGINVHLMLPYLSEWRWGIDDESSNWYSNHRLYRQSVEGDWSTVVNTIKYLLISD